MDKFLGRKTITPLQAKANLLKGSYQEFVSDLSKFSTPDPLTGCRVPTNAGHGQSFGRFTRNSDGIQYRCRGVNEIRVLAHRMVFAGADETAILIADQSVSVSHLCHNDNCCEKTHLVLNESLDYNKSRNTCPAGELCWHFPRCLVAGKQFVKSSDVIYWFEQDKMCSGIVQHRGVDKDGL